MAHDGRKGGRGEKVQYIKHISVREREVNVAANVAANVAVKLAAKVMIKVRGRETVREREGWVGAKRARVPSENANHQTFV
jgi:hypothetical protein